MRDFRVGVVGAVSALATFVACSSQRGESERPISPSSEAPETEKVGAKEAEEKVPSAIATPLSTEPLLVFAEPSEGVPEPLLAGLQKLTTDAKQADICALFEQFGPKNEEGDARASSFVLAEKARRELIGAKKHSFEEEEIAIYACKYLDDQGHCPGSEYKGRPLAGEVEAHIHAMRKEGAEISLVDEGTVAVISGPENCLLQSSSLPAGARLWAESVDWMQELRGCYDGGFACDMQRILAPLERVDDRLGDPTLSLALRPPLTELHEKLMDAALSALVQGAGQEQGHLRDFRNWARRRPRRSPIRKDLTSFLRKHSQLDSAAEVELGSARDNFKLYNSEGS